MELNNILPAGFTAYRDEKGRAFFLQCNDLSDSFGYKIFLDSDDVEVCVPYEALYEAVEIEDYTQYKTDIVLPDKWKINSFEPVNPLPANFKSVRQLIDDLDPAFLGNMNIPDIQTYDIISFDQKGSPIVDKHTIVKFLRDCHFIANDGDWFALMGEGVYKKVPDEFPMSLLYKSLETVKSFPFPPTRTFINDILSAVQHTATPDFLYEKLFELAERNPKYESILNKVDSDYNGNLVPFNNGLYNIDEDILLPYTEFIFQTTIFNCRYDPSIRSHPVEDVYKRIIPDEKTLNFFYEAVGYTLFHKGMNPPSVFLIYGPGNTGKSALLETVRLALGRWNISNLSLAQLSSTYEPAELIGKTMNLASETGEGGGRGPFGARPDGELLKRLSDGTDVVFPRKYKSPITHSNTAKLWFVSNTMPDFGDNSSGWYRRIHIIPCRESQDWNDQIYAIMQDDSAISWLINKTIEGYDRLAARNMQFDPSTRMLREHGRYKQQEGLFDFLASNFNITSKDEIQSVLDGEYIEDVYQSYKLYTIEGGGRPLSKRKMTERIYNEYQLSAKVVNTRREDGRRTCLTMFAVEEDKK